LVNNFNFTNKINLKEFSCQDKSVSGRDGQEYGKGTRDVLGGGILKKA
jgi:hypothetical protein